MEYLLCPNDHLFVAYAAPKKITENPDFIRLLGQKPKLANIFAGFLAYYSHRAKNGHATAFRTKRSTSRLIYAVGARSVTIRPLGT